MNPLLAILWAGLFVAWALIPLIVVQYVRDVVPTRYQEIKERFLRKPPPGSHARAGGRGKSAAWHYVRLRHPDAGEEDAERVLKDQFLYFHHWRRYVLPLALVVVLSGLMLGLSGIWIIGKAPMRVGLIGAPIMMALWGAFVWSLYEIWSRRRSGDLTPVEVFDVALRLVVAIPIGHAFSLLVFDTVPALAAFVASAFPLRDIRQLFRKQALRRLSETPQGTSTLTTNRYLGETLSGMGNDTIVRLEELNIETYLDLAYADPIGLMVKTGVPIQLVLAWIDQALLAVYAAPHKLKFEALGMPCALDVCEFYESHWIDAATGQEKNWREDPAVKDLAARLDIPLEILPQLLRGIWEDPHVQFLSSAWYGPATTMANA